MQPCNSHVLVSSALAGRCECASVIVGHGSGEALHDVAIEALLDLTPLGLCVGDGTVDGTAGCALLEDAAERGREGQSAWRRARLAPLGQRAMRTPCRACERTCCRVYDGTVCRLPWSECLDAE